MPRVVGPIRRTRPVEVRDVEFLRSITDRRIKITVPGPFTMTQQAQNDYYDDERSLALAYAGAVNEELRDLKAAGADVVQIDEPYLQARPEPAREYAVEAIDRALDGIDGDTVLHTCFGYAHIVHDSGCPATRSSRELNECAATHVSIESAQPDLDPGCCATFPTRRSCSASSTSVRTGRDAGRSLPSASGDALTVAAAASGSSPRPTAA